MSGALRDSIDGVKQSKFRPDYVGYYKHLVFELFSQNEELLFPFLGVDSKDEVEGICNHHSGKKVNKYTSSVPFCIGGVGERFSDFKKERLKAILDESAACLNQEVDEILDHILALFHIESDLREKESFYQSASEEEIDELLCRKKRKTSALFSDNPGSYGSFPNSQTLKQVCHEIQALQGNDETCNDGVEKYSVEICSKLGKMEQDLEEYLNVVVSKSRPMTVAEKHQLGQQLRKLPNKALDRVVDIIQLRNLSARILSDNIFVNLEEQDDVALWRLHYYVETVMKANKI